MGTKRNPATVKASRVRKEDTTTANLLFDLKAIGLHTGHEVLNVAVLDYQGVTEMLRVFLIYVAV